MNMTQKSSLMAKSINKNIQNPNFLALTKKRDWRFKGMKLSNVQVLAVVN